MREGNVWTAQTDETLRPGTATGRIYRNGGRGYGAWAELRALLATPGNPVDLPTLKRHTAELLIDRGQTSEMAPFTGAQAWPSPGAGSVTAVQIQDAASEALTTIRAGDRIRLNSQVRWIRSITADVVTLTHPITLGAGPFPWTVDRTSASYAIYTITSAADQIATWIAALASMPRRPHGGMEGLLAVLAESGRSAWVKALDAGSLISLAPDTTTAPSGDPAASATATREICTLGTALLTESKAADQQAADEALDQSGRGPSVEPIAFPNVSIETLSRYASGINSSDLLRKISALTAASIRSRAVYQLVGEETGAPTTLADQAAAAAGPETETAVLPWVDSDGSLLDRIDEEEAQLLELLDAIAADPDAWL